MSYKIFEHDPGLLPFKNDIDQRMKNYEHKLYELVGEQGSLRDFANGHQYFGFHKTDKGWYYREWAPAADAVYLTGDMVEWNKLDLKLTRKENGVFEIFMPGKDFLYDGCHVKTILYATEAVSLSVSPCIFAAWNRIRLLTSGAALLLISRIMYGKARSYAGINPPLTSTGSVVCRFLTLFYHKFINKKRKHPRFHNPVDAFRRKAVYSYDRQFDVIYSSLTFMHISEKKKAFNFIADLLAPNGKFVLSIDKNQDEFIDIGTSKIKVYPDKSSDIEGYVSNANLKLSEHYETEFAHIFVCEYTPNIKSL